MPNYASNTLRIHCDDIQIFEKIRELLFIRNEDGKIEYTMTKLIPIPEVSKSQTNNSLLALYRGISYWGTKWDFCWPELKTYRNEIILDYHTAWGPNDLWVHELCCQIYKMTENDKMDTPPQISVKHHFTIYESDCAGYLYWEPQMEFKYEWFTLDEYAKRFETEIMEIREEEIREQEVFEFNIEDYLPDEPIDEDDQFEIRFNKYCWDMFYHR